MVVITNKESIHFGKVGKIVEEIKDENLFLVYVPKEEALYQFSSSEFSNTGVSNKSKKNTKLNIKNIPKSRKDFYFFITKKETKRRDIVNLIEQMKKDSLFVIKKKKDEQDDTAVSEEYLTDYISDLENSKVDIINEIRTLRDQGFIEFNLPNNSFNPRIEATDEQ